MYSCCHTFPPWCVGDGIAACRVVSFRVNESGFGAPEHLFFSKKKKEWMMLQSLYVGVFTGRHQYFALVKGRLARRIPHVGVGWRENAAWTVRNPFPKAPGVRVESKSVWAKRV